MFKEPIEYEYLNFNLDSVEEIKKITLHYNIVGIDKALSKTLDYPVLNKKKWRYSFNKNLDTTSNFNFFKIFFTKLKFP